jgi:hypothetical protein
MKPHEYDSVNTIVTLLFDFFHPTEDEKLTAIAKVFIESRGNDHWALKRIPWIKGFPNAAKRIAVVDPDSKTNRASAMRFWVARHLDLRNESLETEFRESIARGDSLQPYLKRIADSLATPDPILIGRPRGSVGLTKKTLKTDSEELTPCIPKNQTN